jgi:hypothetical protein
LAACYFHRRPASTTLESSVGAVQFVPDRIEGMDDSVLVTYADTLTYEGLGLGISGAPSVGTAFTVHPSEGLYVM